MEIDPQKGPLFRSTGIKCPACRKVNTEYICTRCNCDLEPLFNLVLISDNKIRQGIKFLVKKDTYSANKYALQAWDIRKTKDAALLGFSASCLSGDKEMAGIWHRKLSYVMNEGKK